MTHDVDHIVEQLGRAGLRPSQRQWELLREAGPLAIPPLVELALDMHKLGGAEPASLGPVHALRLLGEIGAPPEDVIERMIRATPEQAASGNEQASYIWWQELPQMIGRWGRSGYNAARRIILNAEVEQEARAIAVASLPFVAEIEATLRDEVVALLRARLQEEQDAYVLAHVVEALGVLNVADAYADVMAAYKRGAVDRDVLPAAQARQLLLNPLSTQDLKCVHHSLDERYDQHGPYSQAQRNAMAEMARGGAIGS